MKTLLIDYGMGNLGSACRALEECGADVLVSDNPDDLEDCDRFVLPGVGAFAEGMANLNKDGWPPRMREALSNPKVEMLGICLGMQLLADQGHEGGLNCGLGLIPGEVKRLTPNSPDARIPHVGWNEVHYQAPDTLFDAVPNRSDFYFVHSYHFIPAAIGSVLATTPYCGGFVSAVRAQNVVGVQFHPEKSGRHGLQFLRNFLAT
ncbi:MAG TPA: imidazole glycerol phosphate synthase subunit HisH [Candidatus Paceibacterota bacterium]|nr:imidazole glycerol phosphate synthase subunit HisH [Verrucomicrobiota bacterium]HSA09920.1 imidazole glycerol phosphate synthase subunit HisH [Candidatus Paceibacterota bacterium]